MAKNKTIENERNIAEYIAAISDEKRRKDIDSLIALFEKTTGMKAKMWGPGIVGFGRYHYKYASGHEGDAPLAGLSSRANAISLYLSSNFDGRDELLQKFGKYKTGKACIYIQKLEDVDTDVLSKMISKSVKQTKEEYPD